MNDRITASQYLAGVASSRSLYRLLYKEAVGVLPPPRDGQPRSEPIECRLPIRVLADKLDQGRSSVGEDLRRLISYQWVLRVGGAHYALGHRKGATPFLLADVAAEERTGQPELVSRRVLNLPQKRRKHTMGQRRGMARRWRRR